MPSSPSAPSDQPAWSANARTLVTLLILFHGFFMAVAIGSNFAPAAWQIQLLSRFRYYTRLLNFDLNFTPYHLTHATEGDVDHRIEVLPRGQEATGDNWIVLPAGSWPGSETHKRYQRLGAIWAFQAQNNGDPALFAQAIGTHFARQRGVAPQQIRCRRHFLQAQEDLLEGTPNRRDPNDASFFGVVYAANAIVSDSGYVEVIRVDDASQTAQPVGGQQTSGGSKTNERGR